MLAVFGLYVAAVIVVMTSRYFMDELSFEREIDFSLQVKMCARFVAVFFFFYIYVKNQKPNYKIGAVMCGSFIISCWLGTSIHYWSIYANPLPVEPTTLKRPLRDSIRFSSKQAFTVEFVLFLL